MFTFQHARRRRGATVVEFAVIAPVILLFFLSQIVGGYGVSRYQEVACLARSCARYVSTHGGNYYREGVAARTGVPAVTSTCELQSLIARKAVLLDPSKIQVDLSWTAPSSVVPANMPTYVDINPNLVPPAQSVIQNNVTVTVTYQWFPETSLIGPLTLSSTSVMPMSY